MVYQDPVLSMNPTLKIGKQVAECFRILGQSKEEAATSAREALRRVKIADPERVLDRYPHQLSGGMLQRVVIAMALVGDPKLLVLDEPTTGLDPVNVRLVLDLLAERRTRGRTTILSTHHMNEVEALCDRVALIDRGRLMVYGPVDEVRRRYSRPEVRVEARERPPDVPSVTAAEQEAPAVWRLTLAAGAAPSEVLGALVAAGAAIDRFEPILAPIEDIFVRVVQEGRS
jgi:ABC-type glutathione transport system ATPase component